MQLSRPPWFTGVREAWPGRRPKLTPYKDKWTAQPGCHGDGVTQLPPARDPGPALSSTAQTASPSWPQLGTLNMQGQLEELKRSSSELGQVALRVWLWFRLGHAGGGMAGRTLHDSASQATRNEGTWGRVGRQKGQMPLCSGMGQSRWQRYPANCAGSLIHTPRSRKRPVAMMLGLVTCPMNCCNFVWTLC